MPKKRLDPKTSLKFRKDANLIARGKNATALLHGHFEQDLRRRTGDSPRTVK